MNKLVIFIVPLLLLAACGSPEFSANREGELEQTDAVLAQAERKVIKFRLGRTLSSAIEG